MNRKTTVIALLIIASTIAGGAVWAVRPNTKPAQEPRPTRTIPVNTRTNHDEPEGFTVPENLPNDVDVETYKALKAILEDSNLLEG